MPAQVGKRAPHPACCPHTHLLQAAPGCAAAAWAARRGGAQPARDGHVCRRLAHGEQHLRLGRRGLSLAGAALRPGGGVIHVLAHARRRGRGRGSCHRRLHLGQLGRRLLRLLGRLLQRPLLGSSLISGRRLGDGLLGSGLLGGGCLSGGCLDGDGGLQVGK